MPTNDKMTLTILEDGTAKLDIDGISGANHVRAEALTKEFSRFMGGPLKIDTSKKHGHSHSHAHEGVEHKH